MKTSSLTGAELDYWIAKIEICPSPMIMNDVCIVGLHDMAYSPSTNWSQGGPLIEKYSITIIKCKKDDFWQAAINTTCTMDWPEGEYYAEGPTPLIAAMRAIVTSVYGDTVDE